ncbi:MAG: potassium channel family protein [Halodesulfurarchaeum sp.]
MALLPRSRPDVELSRRYRYVLYYLIGLVLMVLLFTVLYNAGMRVYEGEADSIFHSFQIVIETMTTTGYGADSPWETPIMNLFVVLMQLSGIAIAFFTLRLIVIPLFTGAEVNLDNRLSPKRDHVIICEYRRDSGVLLDELESMGVEYVLVSPDREAAKTLSDEGYDAIYGSPQEREAFERAGIDRARAVVADAGDGNVGAILTVRSIDPEIEIIALTDDSDMRGILLDTGADSVLSPHRELGHRLGNMAVSSFRAHLTSSVEVGGNVELTEIPIHPGSQLVGVSIRESPFSERANATVVGVFADGEMSMPPDPDMVLREDMVLLVTGSHEALLRITEYARPTRGAQSHDRIVVLGLGEVGTGAAAEIGAADIDVTTVDVADREDVDVVGDAGSRDTLAAANVETADAVVIGLPTDAEAMLATVLTRALAPDAEIFARVRDPETTSKVLAAGADFVLSVPRVSARMIAAELQDTQLVSPSNDIRLERISAAPFAGSSLADLRLREQTGCLVVGVGDPDGSVEGNVDPYRTFSGAEELTVVGREADFQRLFERFDVETLGRAPDSGPWTSGE